MSRGRSRKSVGGEVRPTTQKILESLSSILRPRLEDALVLDLFAGTGQVGLRMAEMGARRVLFVEGNKRVAQSLRQVLRNHREEEAELSLLVGPVPRVLSKIQGQFDLCLCDPPYDWKEPTSLLPGALPLVSPGGLLVVEHHHKTPYDEMPGWQRHREEKFGETRLSFFERVANDS